MLRVMLLDDEEDALDLLEILLQQIGNVTIAGRYTDPIHALEAIEKMEVDLVFLDIEMPGLKGTQVARKIKNMATQPMIVFTTAYSEYAVEAFEIQSDDYLLKPFQLERLQLSVKRMEERLAERLAFQIDDTSASIQCLGGFYLRMPDSHHNTLAWKTKKEKEICAFLIHHRDQPVDTEVIIEAIWPDYDLAKAKNYLYTCLSYLRKSLLKIGFPAEINKIGKGFTFKANGLKNDGELFENIVQAILEKDILNGMMYRQMNALYKGGYMEGCGYQWAVSKQMNLANKYIRALRKFYEHFKNENATMAEESLQRILTIMPESEKDGRALMQLYMESGKRNEARNTFKQLEQFVHSQLGAELEDETVQVYQQIK